MRSIIPFTTLTALALAGCTMAPSYERPVAPVDQTWSASTSLSTNVDRSVDDIGWREFFKNERLILLIDKALENNRDMRVATLKVEKLRAQYRIQRADLLPSIDATGTASRTRKAGDLTTSGNPTTTSEYNAKAVLISWELDLFGRVQSLKNKALESYLSSEETQRSVRLSLVAEVAQQYMTYVSQSEHLKHAQSTLEAVSRSRDLTLSMRKIGKSSDLDEQTAHAQVAKAMSNVAGYERQLAAARSALVLIVGQPLSDADIGTTSLDEISVATNISAGLPSEILTRRPDILAAEHTLKAANADIGAARAAFFPKIALTGSVGTASNELSGLFNNGNGTWNFAPQITLPIFASGANKASLDAAKIEKKIEVATYEKAIQTAFKEVSDTLASMTPLNDELAANTALVTAQSKRLELAQARYTAGLDNYLVVLSAQQDLYSAQQSLIDTRLAKLSNCVTLYKVLGGGWRDVEVK